MINRAPGGSPTAGRAPSTSAGAGEFSTPQSLAALYNEHGALAFSLAYRIVHDRGAAEDVVQEAFLAAWRNAHRYDAMRGSARTWICQIVRRRALDRLRGSSRRQREHQSLDGLAVLAGSADVVGDVLRSEERRGVVAAVASLTPAQREVIELAYYGGYSQTEIATMTGAPLGTVKGRTRAALRALAASLATMRAADVPVPAAGVRGGDGIWVTSGDSRQPRPPKASTVAWSR